MGRGSRRTKISKPKPRVAKTVGARRRTVWVAGLVIAVGVGGVVFSLLTRVELGFGGRKTSISSLEKLPTLPSSERRLHPLVADKFRKRDPAADGWDTEVLNSRFEAQLKELAYLLKKQENLDEERLREIVKPGAAISALRAERLSAVFADGGLTVYRGAVGAVKQAEMRDIVDAMRGLLQPFDAASDVRVKFKVVRVRSEDATANTSVYYHANGRSDVGLIQQNAVWQCQWTISSDDAAPLLTRIEVESYEEVVDRRPGGPQFADCTEAILAGNESFQRQLLPHFEHWLAMMDTSFSHEFLGHNGLAIGDVNGDGRDDLFVAQPGGLPNLLYVQNEDATATDVSVDAGVDYLNTSQGGLFLDLDNDGDQDLVVAIASGLLIMSNDGQGRYSVRTRLPVGGPHSLAAADYDNDGDLDIYACCYRFSGDALLVLDFKQNRTLPVTSDGPLPYHDANNGRRNVLMRNDGDLQFSDVTVESGMDQNNRRFSFAASWEDYDNDGDMDLYVANDFGRNNLYRNDGGRFEDVAASAGVEDISAGMGVTWGDYNNDGLMDLYVSNMFSSAGQRITYQDRFQLGVDAATRGHFQHHARGNSLFENAGDGTFRDVSVGAAVMMGRWSWGSRFVDINNDGLLDLIATNGFVTNEDSNDL